MQLCVENQSLLRVTNVGVDLCRRWQNKKIEMTLRVPISLGQLSRFESRQFNYRDVITHWLIDFVCFDSRDRRLRIIASCSRHTALAITEINY